MARRRDPEEFLETYGALKKCFTALATEAFAEADVGSLQAKVVRHVGKSAGISQAELARAIGTDPTLIGRALSTLIDRGLVRRERSEQDRRGYVLELTPAGRRARDRVEKARARLATRIVAALDPRDVEDFDRIVKKILAAFER